MLLMQRTNFSITDDSVGNFVFYFLVSKKIYTMEKGSDLVMQFDDLIRCFTILLDSSCEKEFLR